MKCYHLTNPLFLQDILRYGLKPRIGDSTILNHEKDIQPCIFLSLTYEDRFDSTYEEDVLLEVDLPDNQYYKFDPKHCRNKWIMIFNEVPPESIKIMRHE